MLRAEFETLLLSGSDEDVIDAAWDAIPEVYDKEERMIGELLPMLHYADAEICNGGFHQFYVNGIFDPKVVAHGFDNIGLPDIAEIVRNSRDVFPESSPPVRDGKSLDEMEEILDELGIGEEAFAKLESEYYKICGSIRKKFAEHIRGNSDLYYGYLKANQLSCGIMNL